MFKIRQSLILFLLMVPVVADCASVSTCVPIGDPIETSILQKELDKASIEGTFKHIMWYVFGAFMFLLPSSVKILRDSGSFSTQWSRSAAIATVVLSIFSIVLPKIVTGLQLGGYGPYMGYGFCLLLLALYVALIGEINKVLTGVAVLAVIAVGGYYTFVVFFLGSFYNGGMGSHLFFLSALVVGTFFCGFRFERLHKMSG